MKKALGLILSIGKIFPRIVGGWGDDSIDNLVSNNGDGTHKVAPQVKHLLCELDNPNSIPKPR